MAANGEIHWDEKALNQTLAESHELRQQLHRIGDKGAEHAKRISPRRSGDYADAFVVTVGRTADGIPLMCLANTDWKARWIERGTAPHLIGRGERLLSMEASHILDRTLDHLRD